MTSNRVESTLLTLTNFLIIHPPTLFADRAIKANFDASTAMFLVSVIGIGNTIGRIVCGVASSLPGVNALVVNNVFISVGGLLTIFSGLSLTQGYQFFYAAGFGLSICKCEIMAVAAAALAF